MKILNSRFHGVIDYATGLLLVMSPWLFGFDNISNATNTMLIMGIVVLGLSLITNYPLGLIKKIPFPIHGRIETVGALFLLASPWLVGFSEVEIARNLAIFVSVAWIGVVAITNYESYYLYRHS